MIHSNMLYSGGFVGFQRLIVFIVLLIPQLALSQEKDVYDLPEVVALQNRTYYLNHGLEGHVGYLPIDAFNKGIIVGGSYTYYFSEFTGWEIINANYNFNIETDLREDAKSQGLDVRLEDADLLDFVIWYMSTAIIYTPLYNKNLLFNKSIVYGETSFVLGGGVANFDIAGIRPLITIGAVVRFFLGQSTSLNIDIREHVYFRDSEVDGLFTISLGLAFQLGDPPKTSNIRRDDEEF